MEQAPFVIERFQKALRPEGFWKCSMTSLSLSDDESAWKYSHRTCNGTTSRQMKVFDLDGRCERVLSRTTRLASPLMSRGIAPSQAGQMSSLGFENRSVCVEGVGRGGVLCFGP